MELTTLLNRCYRFMAKWVRPKSIPACADTWRFGRTASSQSSETKCRPAASLETVTVVTLAAFGSVRDQTMGEETLRQGDWHTQGRAQGTLRHVECCKCRVAGPVLRWDCLSGRGRAQRFSGQGARVGHRKGLGDRNIYPAVRTQGVVAADRVAHGVTGSISNAATPRSCTQLASARYAPGAPSSAKAA